MSMNSEDSYRHYEIGRVTLQRVVFVHLRALAAVRTPVAFITKMIGASVQRAPDADVAGWLSADRAGEYGLRNRLSYFFGELGWSI